jgi:hypothetical protein
MGGSVLHPAILSAGQNAAPGWAACLSATSEIGTKVSLNFLSRIGPGLKRAGKTL